MKQTMTSRSLREIPIIFAMSVMIVGAFLVVWKSVVLVDLAVADGDYRRLIEIVVLYGIIGLLIYSVVTFCIAEYACLRRRLDATTDSDAEGAAIHDGEGRRKLLLLIPSYKENEEVIRQALISAALVEYPARRVVLLIDDLPAPATDADARILAAARQLPERLQALFAGPAGRLRQELAAWRARARNSPVDPGAEAPRLSRALRSGRRVARRAGTRLRRPQPPD